MRLLHGDALFVTQLVQDLHSSIDLGLVAQLGSLIDFLVDLRRVHVDENSQQLLGRNNFALSVLHSTVDLDLLHLRLLLLSLRLLTLHLRL